MHTFPSLHRQDQFKKLTNIFTFILLISSKKTNLCTAPHFGQNSAVFKIYVFLNLFKIKI